LVRHLLAANTATIVSFVDTGATGNLGAEQRPLSCLQIEQVYADDRYTHTWLHNAMATHGDSRARAAQDHGLEGVDFRLAIPSKSVFLGAFSKKR